MEVWRAMGRGRVVVAVWVLFGISALAMFGWPGLTGAVSQACHGWSALDVRSHWTAADARDLVAACGTEGRAAYLRLQLLDLAYRCSAAWPCCSCQPCWSGACHPGDGVCC